MNEWLLLCSNETCLTKTGKELEMAHRPACELLVWKTDWRMFEGVNGQKQPLIFARSKKIFVLLTESFVACWETFTMYLSTMQMKQKKCFVRLSIALPFKVTVGKKLSNCFNSCPKLRYVFGRRCCMELFWKLLQDWWLGPKSESKKRACSTLYSKERCQKLKAPKRFHYN